MSLPENLHIETVVDSMFSENALIVWQSGRSDCLVVDPGLNPQGIVEVLEREELDPVAVLNTHGHADHIAGNEYLKMRYPASKLVIGAGDSPKLTDPVQNLSAKYGLDLTSPEADVLVHEGETQNYAGFELEVFDTPGHSSGHVVFVWKGSNPWVVFGGDVLFAGSIGRTDFPDGSMPQLIDSIQNKLFKFPDDTIVLPGHGPATTIGQEKRTNPFVGEHPG